MEPREVGLVRTLNTVKTLPPGEGSPAPVRSRWRYIMNDSVCGRPDMLNLSRSSLLRNSFASRAMSGVS